MEYFPLFISKLTRIFRALMQMRVFLCECSHDLWRGIGSRDRCFVPLARVLYERGF